jgi:hypothetical protein
MHRLTVISGLIAAATLAGVCLVASAAHADWTTQTGENPMNDGKWAAMTSLTSSGLPISVKCWEKGQIQAMIVLGSYEGTATYKPVVSTKFRIDKGEPFELPMTTNNFNGMLLIGAIGEPARNFLKALSSAKERVVFALDMGGDMGITVSQTDARDIGKAVEVLTRVCKLPEEQP